MSSEIMLREYGGDGDSDEDLRLRWENTVNTPIVSASWLGNNFAIADVYTIVAASANTVDITADDPKNEHVGTGLVVVADGATVNDHTLPGIGLVFSATLAAGWTAKVSVGANMATDGSTEDRLNVGIVLEGETSTARRIIAENVGSEDSAETKIYACPGFWVDGTSAEDFIETLEPHTDTARHTTAVAGDYAITFADFHDVGGVKYVDVYVDGVKAIEDAALDGSTRYEYGDGHGYVDAADKLKGLSIIFANTASDPSALTFTLYVRGGWEFVELAPDSGGSPGSWQSPPLTVTESGEVSGVITPSGYADFWFRLNVPDGTSPGDRRLAFLMASGLTI